MGTYREQFDSAMTCNTKEEADAWLKKEIIHYVQDYGKSASEAEEIIKVNLGYMGGYCDDSTAQKILRLFGAPHPIFGTRTPTAEEALEAGKKLGEASR